MQMTTLQFPPINKTAIALGTELAKNYVLPSVNAIFDAAIPASEVNILDTYFGQPNPNGGLIFPSTFGTEYYNISWLWPQYQVTGIVWEIEEYCNPKICSLLFGQLLYLPNFAANIFFAIMFGIALLINIPLGIKQRTWGYMVGMVFGMLCEVLGYVGRVLMNQNIFAANPFYIYIVCLTIGPAFLSFSIYTCLARTIVIYGRHHARFAPRTYTIVFAVSDFFSLVLQGAGGGLAATGNNHAQSQRGVNLMIAGLAWQVFSLTLFVLAYADFAVRVYLHRRRSSTIATESNKDPNVIVNETEKSDAEEYLAFRQSRRFKFFLIALGIATLTIYVRCCFRVAELRQGFRSRIANDEPVFMVLEATMIFIATVALTAAHPTLVFGGLWREVSGLARLRSNLASKA